MIVKVLRCGHALSAVVAADYHMNTSNKQPKMTEAGVIPASRAQPIRITKSQR